MRHPPVICRRPLLGLGLGGLLPAQLWANGVVPVFVGEGNDTGLTPRLLAWLGAEAALSWHIRPTPWLRAQRLTAGGDGVMFGLGRTPQREVTLAFSLPVWTNHTWAVVRDGEQGSIDTYGDLDGQWVCWARGSSYGELFTHAGLGRMQALESNDDDTAMRMVAAGRCRAALITLETHQADRALQHRALAQLQARGLALVPVPLAAVPLHFACGRGSRWSWVLDRLNPVLARSRSALDRLREP